MEQPQTERGRMFRRCSEVTIESIDRRARPMETTQSIGISIHSVVRHN
jgi:hypothetical protein